MARSKSRHPREGQAAARRHPHPKAPRPKAAHPAKPQEAKPATAPASRTRGLLLYGSHAVRAALANPRRRCHRLLLTEEARRREGADLERLAGQASRSPALEPVERQDLDLLLPGAVHEGIALEVAPLSPPSLPEFLDSLPEGPALVVLLDQVTDPHNVGAILRSAAVFGAAALVVPERHAPPETGVLAKTASGALERVPYLREVNLARCLDQLKEAGFWVLGFAGEAPQSLGSYDPPERVALCLGAEGSGLRRLTRERCDLLLSLPAAGDFRDLNVSNAAAVALYALSQKRLGQE